MTTPSAILELGDRQLQAQQTYSLVKPLGLHTALGLSLLIACHTGTAANQSNLSTVQIFGLHSDTAHTSVTLSGDTTELVTALVGLHHLLVLAQEDLSAE